MGIRCTSVDSRRLSLILARGWREAGANDAIGSSLFHPGRGRAGEKDDIVVSPPLPI